MPRSKAYNRSEVLEKATYLFYQRGYQATSMAEIVKVTGLNSASLYKEFGGKDGLFEAAIEYYSENIISVFTQLIIDEPNLSGITKFLDGIVNLATSKDYLGCLVMNSLTEMDAISRKAHQQICDFCTNLERYLESALSNAKANGEIPADKDPTFLASYIAFNIHGLVLYGKHPDKKKNIPMLYEVIRKAINS